MPDASFASVRLPLRVVHVTFGLDVGGLERLLLEIGQRSDPARMQLCFVSLGHIGPIGAALREVGWPVVSLHRPSGARPSLLFSLARVFHGIRADVVHTHDVRALIYGAPAARLAFVRRVIHTQHGQNLKITSRQLKLMRFAAKRTDHFVCVSQDVKRIAAEQGVPLGRLLVIHNGVDVHRLQLDAREPATGKSPGPLAAVARLSPEKDVATLLRAVSIARQSIADLNLEIAGDGPSRTELEREVKQLGIGDRVRFLGSVSDPTELLRRAQIFVLPSLSEGLSLTLLEAMAIGVPTIATHVGGNPEVIQHGKTGLLVPPGNPTAMAGAIGTLWSDASAQQRMAAAAQQRVADRFDVHRMVYQYEQLYFSDDEPVRATREMDEALAP